MSRKILCCTKFSIQVYKNEIFNMNNYNQIINKHTITVLLLFSTFILILKVAGERVWAHIIQQAFEHDSMQQHFTFLASSCKLVVQY